MTALTAAVAPAAAAPTRAGTAARPVPRELPARSAALAARQPQRWLVGARPGARADAVAARHGAERLTGRGIYRIDRGRARALARALRASGLLRFSEPDVVMTGSQAPAGGDDLAATDWRQVIRPPAMLLPPAGAPLTAVVDNAADTTHPDLAGTVRSAGVTAVGGWHGTAVSSLVGGQANALGMAGAFPGAPVLAIGIGSGDTFSAGEIARGIAEAVKAGARIVNLSLGGDYSYAVELEIAYAASAGVLPVAAAGNDRGRVLPDGTRNPVIFPAALPHVLSVASMGPTGASSRFSTSNGAVDVSAPGERVLAAVPVGLDPDGVLDGYTRADGTSFASPIVAGAAAWLLAARAGLRADQAGDLLRITARDLGREGWDQDSGYGLIDLQGALAAEAPPVDPAEVNDDIPWVDGTRFRRPDRPLFRAGSRRARLAASIDLWKDFADVYRLQVPARRQLRVTVIPARYADPELELYSTRARTIYKRRGRLAGSYRRAGKADVAVVPAARRRRIVYAVVFHAGEDAAYLDAPYVLTVRRSTRR